MILILIFIFACFESIYSYSLCPYPLPSHIEPCYCDVDNDYRIFLTCRFGWDFVSADFDRIVSAFDYNHTIFTFRIDLTIPYRHSYGYQSHPDGDFSVQLNRNNVGRLNITNFIIENVELNVNDNLIEEGAFEGSYGAIETIHIYDKIGWKNGSIDLDKVLAHAGPTLKSLKLSYVKNLRSSSFWFAPALSEITFLNPRFDHIPANTFSGEYLPALASVELKWFTGQMTIESNAFTNLKNLTSLKMTSLGSIEKVERGAFNNISGIRAIDFSGSVINGIEEDSFMNLSSLTSFDLFDYLLGKNVTYLPRLLSGSPLVTSVTIGKCYVENVAKDFFVGTPNVEIIGFNLNKKLEKMIIQDLRKLRSLSLSPQRRRESNQTTLSIELRNLPNLKSFIIYGGIKPISSASFSEMENLERIEITSNKLETICIDSTPNLQILNLENNKLLNHSGLTTSLHGLLHPDININLQSTNIRNLDEFTFRPLIERLNETSESTGKIKMNNVKLDCGCDVKWLVVDIGRTDFFSAARCPSPLDYLYRIDPLLFKDMCPPEY